mgnify:FL=1
MATTYYYNVWLQQKLNNIWCNITVQDIKINFNDFRVNPPGVSYTDEAGNVLGSYSEVGWRVEAFKVVDGGTPVRLTKDEVKVNASGTATSVTGTGLVTGSASTGNFFFCSINKTLLSTNALKFPYVVKPTFVVKLKNQAETVVPIAKKSGVDFTGVQSVTFTKATTFPQTPTALINELDPMPTPGSDRLRAKSNIHYDASIKQFIGIKTTYNTKDSTNTYSAVYYTPGADGTKIKEVPIGSEKASLGSKGPVYKAAQALLIDAIDSAKVTNEKVPQTGSGTGQYTTNSAIEPIGDERWNPPPHPATKGVQREWSIDKLVKAKGYTTSKDYAPVYLDKVVQNGIMGRIFQDADSALSVNTNPSISKKGQLWGFRFMYNPTTIAYSNTANVNVDFTLGAPDVANLLAGNINVKFELYINRIVDLTDLQNTKTLQTAYNPPLKDAAIQGLLNRGTEYDIEFLYRVLNGDPDTVYKVTPLFSKAYQGITSDIGYMKALPCWIVLNENFRIYGTINSINVNHRIFDKRMVPVFSTVELDITRYPAILKYDSKDPADKKYDFNALKEALQNQYNTDKNSGK